MDLLASICYNNIKMPRKDIDYMAKKNTKHGFTLVELIVVLVILAILAALLIPALTGYIDKARKSQVVAETRALTQAVQTEMSTVYALNDEFQRHMLANSQWLQRTCSSMNVYLIMNCCSSICYVSCRKSTLCTTTPTLAAF